MGFILFCVLMSQVILEWIWPTDVRAGLHKQVEEKKRKIILKNSISNSNSKSDN